MLRLSFFLALWSAAVFAADPKPASVSGRVTVDFEVLSPEGQPVAGAEVLVMQRPNFNQEAKEDLLLASGESGADGRFHVSLSPGSEGLPRFGSIIVRKKGVGVAGFSRVLVHAEKPDQPPSPAQPPVKLVPEAECRVQLFKPDGSPAAGVHVWVDQCTMPEDPRGFMFTLHYLVPRLPELGWEGTTDAEGCCVIPGLPREAYLYLRHDAAGLAQLPGRHQIHFKDSPRALDAGSTHTLVAAGALRGRVTLPDGTPVRGGSLGLLEAVPYTTAYGDQTRTDEEGRFEFSRVPPSSYKIRFRGPSRDEDLWVGDENVPVQVEAEKVAEMGGLKLAPVALVTGHVRDAESGVEIEEPIIFRLKEGAHDLRYRMHRMGPKGYLPPASRDSIHVEVKAGEKKEIVFRLQPMKAENRVVGTVLDPQGKPAAQAFVTLMGRDKGGIFYAQMTDGKGAFSLTVNDPQGALSVVAWNPDAISEPTPVKPGDSVYLRLQDSGLASVRGVIRDEQGKPLAQGRVQFFNAQFTGFMENPVRVLMSGRGDGAFHLPRLPKAVTEFTLTASAEGYGNEVLRDQVLKPGEAFEWNPVLRPVEAAVSGIVVDKNGAAVSGVEIRINGDGQPDRRVEVTDANGRFRVDKLAARQLHVWARQRTDAFSREAFAWTKAPASGLRLVLPEASGTVSGVVRDHRGKPVAGVEVNAFARGRKTTADVEGRFELTGLEDGWFTVQLAGAAGAGGARWDKPFRLRTGSTNASLVLPESPGDEDDVVASPVDLTGRPAPEIHVATWLHTEPLAAKAGGKVRILDFWGMECAPCLSGFPKVQKFWEQHQKEGIEIIALSAAFYPQEEVREYLEKHPELKFPMAIRSEDSRDSQAYQVRGIPTYVVIGKDGKILSSSHDWEVATAVALKANGTP